MRLKVDEYYNGSIPKPVVVKAQWGPIELYDTSYIPVSNNFSLELYFSELSDTIDYGKTQRVWIDPVLDNGCIPFYADPEITYEIEILEGKKYATLIDIFNGTKTKKLTGYYAYCGSTVFDIKAEGNSPPHVFPLTIKMTASNPEAATKTMIIYFNPSPLYVYTNPEIVGVSDTVEVIIPKRNNDGTLENFPEEQTFELAVLDGCVNGNILVGDSLGVYFSDAQLPIYFVAADSLAGDSGIVRLRVGTDLGNAGMQPMLNIAKRDNEITEEQKKLSELRSGYEKMIENKKAELNKSNLSLNEQLKSNAPITEVCYIGDYLYETGYWEGDVVGVDECGDYPCNQGFVYSPPSIVSNLDDIIWSTTFTNEYGTRDFCPDTHSKGGKTNPLFDNAFDVPFNSGKLIKDELISKYTVDACFDKVKNKWKYLIMTNDANNEIKLRVLVSMCHWSDPTDIIDIQGLKNIPKNENCDALKDFEKHRPYHFNGEQIPAPEKYYIKDAAVNHEKVHVKFFQLDITKTMEIKHRNL